VAQPLESLKHTFPYVIPRGDAYRPTHYTL